MPIPGNVLKKLNFVFLQSGGVGGGMSSNATPMSRSGMDNMGGSYAGANDMTNNGLSANQNQVNQNIL